MLRALPIFVFSFTCHQNLFLVHNEQSDNSVRYHFALNPQPSPLPVPETDCVEFDGRSSHNTNRNRVRSPL